MAKSLRSVSSRQRTRYRTFHVSIGTRKERPTNDEIHMFETETKKGIVHARYAADAKTVMNTQLLKLLMISSLIAFIYGHVHAAELSDDPLPTVQENVATNKAVLVDVREPGEWKEGHVEGAISLPLSSLRNGVDTTALEQEVPKDKIVYMHCVMGV